MKKYLEIYNILKKRKIVIYGTGHVAMKFYDLLVWRGLNSNIESFLVTRISDKKEIKQIPIKKIDEFENKDEYIICIAVHTALRDEVEGELARWGYTNILWIYPYLYELLFGEPKKENVIVSVDDIIQHNLDYRFAVRYLAVENYFGKNQYGAEIYIKAQSLHCECETARKRLDKFYELIEQWEKNGYDSRYRIYIDENGVLLDGAHRVTLAKYFNCKEFNCDIFSKSEHFIDWEGKEPRLTKEILNQAGFNKNELQMIESAYQHIRERSS